MAVLVVLVTCVFTNNVAPSGMKLAALRPAMPWW